MKGIKGSPFKGVHQYGGKLSPTLAQLEWNSQRPGYMVQHKRDGGELVNADTVVKERTDESVEVFSMDSAERATRLDNLLADRYPESRNYFARLIAEGAVLVNGRARKTSFKVKGGDEVSVRFSPDERQLDLVPEAMDLDI